jgi:pimeloyl-ACP methyl ester carboxylesterase
MQMIRCLMRVMLMWPLVLSGQASAQSAPPSAQSGVTSQTQSSALSGFGIVLLHGKGSTPTSMIEGLSNALKKEGALVDAPEMPWSQRRIYDATYDAAMVEIDRAVERLKVAGAARIVVAGHSLGANAAIGYAARQQNLAAVIALAPGHLPEAWALRLRTKSAIAKARQLVAEGKGDVPTSFPDLAQGIPFQVTATPSVYLSMFDPAGPAVIPKNAAMIGDVPLLWVVGIGDPIFLHGRDYAFTLAAKDPRSKYLVIPGLHLTTPFQARRAVVDWLKSL